MRHLLFTLFFCLSFFAHAAIDPGVVKQLGAEESEDKIVAIRKLAQSAEPEAVKLLQELAAGTLKDAKGEEISINNRVRREIDGALAGLRLFDSDPVVRLKATREVAAKADASQAPMLAKALEKIALEDDYFVSRKLYPNVDFYSGIVQRAIGIPVNLFTGMFALARTVGWIAQLNEMIGDPEYKIGRPRQLFTGAERRDVLPLAKR